MIDKSDFQGVSYRNPAEMAAAIAESWLEAGGLNDRAQIAGWLAEMSDAALADEAIEAWGLDVEVEDEFHIYEDAGETPPTWLAERGLDRDAVVAAFADLRATLEGGSDQ